MVPVPLDVSDRAAVLAAAATVRDELGGIDVAIRMRRRTAAWM